MTHEVQQLAGGAVIWDRIGHRSDRPERVMTGGIRLEATTQIVFWLLGVLLLVQSVWRIFPYVEGRVGDWGAIYVTDIALNVDCLLVVKMFLSC